LESLPESEKYNSDLCCIYWLLDQEWLYEDNSLPNYGRLPKFLLCYRRKLLDMSYQSGLLLLYL
jgi:hypothetical protein